MLQKHPSQATVHHTYHTTEQLPSHATKNTRLKQQYTTHIIQLCRYHLKQQQKLHSQTTVHLTYHTTVQLPSHTTEKHPYQTTVHHTYHTTEQLPSHATKNTLLKQQYTTHIIQLSSYHLILQKTPLSSNSTPHISYN